MFLNRLAPLYLFQCDTSHNQYDVIVPLERAKSYATIKHESPGENRDLSRTKNGREYRIFVSVSDTRTFSV